jgi:transcriptional activator HAC1
MDATLVALRFQSEQQLARDCLSGVDACDLLDDGKSPSVEALMTLLWAIKVIEKEQTHQTPKLDAAAEVRQACSELDNMFRLREMNGNGKHYGISLVSSREGGGTIGEKSSGWMA